MTVDVLLGRHPASQHPLTSEGQVDRNVCEQALVDAQALIDSYRVDADLGNVLNVLLADIAWYRLTGLVAGSEDDQQRYHGAIKQLERLSRRKDAPNSPAVAAASLGGESLWAKGDMP